MSKKRIRVLHLIDILKGGGAEELVKEIIRLTDRSKFELKLCYLLESPRKTYIDEIEGMGTKIFYLGLNRKLSTSIISSSIITRNNSFRAFARHIYLIYCLAKLRNLYRTVIKERIEVIHAHLPYSFVLASLVGGLLKVPVVCQVSQMRSQTLQTASWSFLAYRFLQGSVHTFYTNISADELMRYAGVPGEKIRYFKGVIDLKTVTPVEKSQNPLYTEFNLDDSYPILLSMGRFVPEKGHKYAMGVTSEMKRQFPGMKHFILGEGWEIEKFRRQISELGLEKTIILPGYRRDLQNFYSIADIYLRTNLIEGGSLATYHAMAYGNPIIGFDTKAPTETITHEKNGFLVPVGDTEKMTEYALRLARDDDLRGVIGRESRSYAYSTLDLQDTINIMENDYLRLCNGKRRVYRSRK